MVSVSRYVTPFRRRVTAVSYTHLDVYKRQGSLGSRSAKLLAPYSDASDTDGILVQSQQELNEHMLKAYEMGLQPATHCIGDKGLDCVLTAIEYTLEKSREHGMTAREQADRDPFRICLLYTS